MAPDIVLLPGLTLGPRDYAALVARLGVPVAILDTLQTPVTRGVDELRAVLAHSEPVTLIGHSAGGLAAIEWALRFPDTVRRVVLLDPSDPFSIPQPGGLARVVFAAALGAVRVAGSIPPLARVLARAGRRRVLAMYGVHTDLRPRADVDAAFGSRAAVTAVLEQVRDFPAQAARVRALLPDSESGSRWTVLRGAAGSPIGAGQVTVIAATLGAEIVDIDAGHLFPLTHPEEAAAAIRVSLRA